MIVIIFCILDDKFDIRFVSVENDIKNKSLEKKNKGNRNRDKIIEVL